MPRYREPLDGLGWPPAGGFIEFEYFDHRYRLKSGGAGWVLMRDSEPRAIAVLQQTPSGWLVMPTEGDGEWHGATHAEALETFLDDNDEFEFEHRPE